MRFAIILILILYVIQLSLHDIYFRILSLSFTADRLNKALKNPLRLHMTSGCEIHSVSYTLCGNRLSSRYVIGLDPMALRPYFSISLPKMFNCYLFYENVSEVFFFLHPCFCFLSVYIIAPLVLNVNPKISNLLVCFILLCTFYA